jgi:hypothetical protein
MNSHDRASEDKAPEEERQEKEGKPSTTLTKAILGLIGTLLTVCGGLTGALLTAGLTIYQVEREAQQVALAAPDGDKTVSVDTRQIAIDRSEATRLSPDKYVVDTDLGFVMAQPLAEWEPLEETTFRDILFDKGTISPMVTLVNLADTAWDDQPVRRIRYAEPVEIQYDERSTENGIPINLELLQALASGDTLIHHSQIALLIVDKQVSEEITLASIATTWGPDPLLGGGVNSIVANRESQYVMMQVTSELENVRIDGRRTDVTIERWALFAEGPQHHYMLELIYVPVRGQSMQVWEDLQAYFGAFRVVE